MLMAPDELPLITNSANDYMPVWWGLVNAEPTPPAVQVFTMPADPVAVRATVSATTTFTDAGASETHMAIWEWGDGATTTGTVDEGTVSGSHAYTSAGIYRVTVTVTDNDGETGTATSDNFLVASIRTAGS